MTLMLGAWKGVWCDQTLQTWYFPGNYSHLEKKRRIIFKNALKICQRVSLFAGQLGVFHHWRSLAENVILFWDGDKNGQRTHVQTKKLLPSDFVGGLKPTFKQFSSIFRFFRLGKVLMMWLILPPSTEAMTSFTELLARTKPAPEPEVAEAPAEAEAASWGVALGRVGWVGWPLGVGSLFFPWNHGALSRTSPTVLVCMSFSLCVCVWVLIFRFLISGTCGWTYTVDQLDSPATWLSEFLQYINNS